MESASGVEGSAQGIAHTGHPRRARQIPTLLELCTTFLERNSEALLRVPIGYYSHLKKALARCSVEKLHLLEQFNRHMIEESDELWEAHCIREFSELQRLQDAGQLEVPKSWKQLYMAKRQEKQEKSRRAAANASAATEAARQSVKKIQVIPIQHTHGGKRKWGIPMFADISKTGGVVQALTLDPDRPETKVYSLQFASSVQATKDRRRAICITDFEQLFTRVLFAACRVSTSDGIPAAPIRSTFIRIAASEEPLKRVVFSLRQSTTRIKSSKCPPKKVFVCVNVATASEPLTRKILADCRISTQGD
ncbi:hypothetical protein HDV00_002252 [Rhizophlyctis rosea]|nr:hypothetical protein HDV00_002252 [Rhizophlyctis rosea]